MNRSLLIAWAALSTAVVLAACQPEPVSKSAIETSAARAELADRIRFIETYVSFRRGYRQLEYNVVFHDNSGGWVPGPSDWDVQLLAVVPPAEVDDWIPADTEKAEGPPPAWVKQLPGKLAVEGVTEWYRSRNRAVGIDRKQSLIAYRNTSFSGLTQDE